MMMIDPFRRSYTDPEASIGDLFGWYRFHDSGDAGLVTVSSGEINTAIDQSTNSRDLDGTGHAPDVDAAALNGYDVADGDGSEYWSSSSPGLYAAGACTAIVVANGTPARFDRVVGEGDTAGGGGNNAQYFLISGYADGATSESSHKIRNDALGDITQADSGVDPWDGSWHIYGIRDTGSEFIPVLDGVEGTTDSYTRSGSVTPNTLAVLTRADSLGSNSPALKVGEIPLFSAALSDYDLDREVGRLAHFWGLTGNLPAGHPFKTFPPNG